jgi:hypothetical protein
MSRYNTEQIEAITLKILEDVDVDYHYKDRSISVLMP